MKPLQAIKNYYFPKNKHFTGVLLDIRSESEKKKDFLHEEITAGGNVPIYRTKNDILPITKKYFKENQQQTSSCVAHSSTLALGIDNEIEGDGYVRLSKAFFYRNRGNFPGEGMGQNDSGKIASTKGSCLFETLPTAFSEEAMNSVSITPAMFSEALMYRSKNYVSISSKNDINTLVSIISTGKAVPIFIFASYREWAQEYPQVIDNVTLYDAVVRHSPTILPNSGFIENGKKYIAVQDSAWFGGFNIRFLSEDFIRERVYYAQYFINLKNTPASNENKPKHLFTKLLKFGMEGDEVLWLQKCLQFEGLFPSNVKPTGKFYGITLKAVKDFQMKYATEILDPAGIIQPTGIVGIYTNKKLNQLYN
jgi:hypothetical protein